MSAPSSSAAPGNRDGDAQHLRVFLRWLLPIAIFFGLVETGAFVPTGNIQILLTGLAILAYAGVVVAAQGSVRRGELDVAVWRTAAGILVTAISIAIVQPELWAPLSGVPFVAVGVALPTLRGRDLRNLLLGSGVAIGLIAVLGALNLVPSHQPTWFLATFNAGAVIAVATLVLILLLQFSERLTGALEAAVDANGALVGAQAALESERERLDTTLRSIGDGVVASDVAGRVMFVNPIAERLTGWTSDEAIGQPADSLLRLEPDPDGPGHAWLLAARDGSTRAVAHASSPIRGADGSIHGAVAVVRDVSDERRLARERLAIDRRIVDSQQLESLATLAGGIAQQFNNLLAVILGNASIVRDEIQAGRLDGDASTALDDIEDAAARAAALARQMLAFSGRGRFALTALDLSMVVSETLPLVRTGLPTTIEIRTTLASDLPAIEADETQLRQLVAALVVNAAESIGEGPGAIAITTRTTTIAAVGGSRAGATMIGDSGGDGPIGSGLDSVVVVLEVTDTGSGMDELTRRQVFQPFFSTKFVGRGLGLAAAQGVVRGHLGRIDVRSTPGGGSTFTVLLPALEP